MVLHLWGCDTESDHRSSLCPSPFIHATAAEEGAGTSKQCDAMVVVLEILFQALGYSALP